MPLPMILDVDTGVDDALALMLAARHPDVDLKAVTCVAGNTDVDQVVANTLYVLDAAGAGDIPVARGAARPLIAPVRTARHVHGADGLGGFSRPSDRRASPLPALELLRRELTAAATDDRRVTLVPLGPMTNIALLLRAYPKVAAGLERIVFMGGSAGSGNATAAAEFNVWQDPEAAAIVLAACGELGVAVTMYGLDVFPAVTVNGQDASSLRALPDPAAQLAGSLIDHQRRLFARDSVTIGDAGTVCSVIDPGGLVTQRLPVRVELGYGHARGQTIVDRREWAGDVAVDPQSAATGAAAAPGVDVALDVDASRYARVWLAAFDA